jgi:hypothetical protein
VLFTSLFVILLITSEYLCSLISFVVAESLKPGSTFSMFTAVKTNHHFKRNLMKKLFILQIALCSLITMNAQNVRFGITAGTSIASQKFKASGISISGDSKVGFTAGVLADLGLSENFVFQPGLNFVQKGSKISSGGVTATQTLNYIELPLNALYKTSAGSGSFFAGIGPALGYGFGGTAKSDGESQDIHFGSSDNDDYKPFEFSGNILAGYEFSNGFFVSANYNHGFSNILNGGDADQSAKNNYFGIRLGYKFGGEKK